MVAEYSTVHAFLEDPRTVVLNLWVVTPLGVTCQISCTSDIYIVIHKVAKLQL